MSGKPSISFLLLKIILTGYIISLLSSCVTSFRNYPRNKPFVYKTNINVIGEMPNAQRTDLADKLENQLDDSMRARPTKKLLRKIYNNPPAYDVASADKSVLFMRALLASMGYFYDSTWYTMTVDSSREKPDRLPATITFNIEPRQLTTLDSVWYNISDSNLQRLTLNSQRSALVKKGDAFSKGPISSELNRLVELYRNNGYLRFGFEDLIGLWDTVDVNLLQPTLDPFEQLEILRKLAERRKNPTARLEIRLRPGHDSAKLTKYFIGKVNIYPDSTLTIDTGNYKRESAMVAPEMYVIQGRNKFKPKIFPINIYLKHDSLYRQRRYQQTINRLTNIGTWRLINIQSLPRFGQDTVDFHIILTPADKYLFTANFEASQNQSAVAGNLFGIGINTSLQNRNFLRAANLSTLSLRYGVELGNKFIQTQQASVSYNISFPRPVFLEHVISERLRDNMRTVFGFNGANTERRELYNLTTINGSWSYEFQSNRSRKNPNKAEQIIFKFPNIEYSYLTERDSLRRLIEANPSLRSIFNDGFIESVIAGYTRANTKENRPNVFAINLENSPTLSSLIPSKFLDSQLYRFTKVNAEFTQLFKRLKSSVALRAFLGVGYEWGSTKNPLKRNNLPFFKQYFAGGPNSMRAWRLRKLGPGSVVKSFKENPERYGDVQLEFNAEYRFLLATIAGVKLESALFTDIGNIWFLKDAAGEPEEVFNFGRLAKDLAIGVGTGLRLDFTFFLIRVDYAFKAKDPSPEDAAAQNKWFYDFHPLRGQLQIGINYPFKL